MPTGQDNVFLFLNSGHDNIGKIKGSELEEGHGRVTLSEDRAIHFDLGYFHVMSMGTGPWC